MNDAELAVAAARVGAGVVRARYGAPLTHFAKTTLDFATEADIETEDAITVFLSAHRPGDAVIGEEAGASGTSDAGRSWLVDPICGTLNFAARTPLAAVNVALKVGDTITAAASADPFADEVFWTDGRRAYLGTDLLQPSVGSRIVDLDARCAATLLADDDFTAAFSPRVLSTTLALAWTAAGRHAGYVSDGELRDSVHYSAGIALCRTAGCVLTDLRGGPLFQGPGLLAAADQDTHVALLRMIANGLN